MIKIKRAIISVTDKAGVEEFAKELCAMGVEILSTGGTARLLKDAGVAVVPISTFTGFPEILDGRVKTLHPKIHGGILGIRSNEEHKKAMEEHSIEPIDMVVVNLYRFEQTIADGADLEEAIENIDIGGPGMLRASAKNYPFVTAVTDPGDYNCILEEMRTNGASISRPTRFALAKKVYALTARYDGAISNYLGGLADEDVKTADRDRFPETISLQYNKLQGLRYGENPHQSAAYYINQYAPATRLTNARKLHGKALSYNNISDLNACTAMVREFTDPVAVLVKHNNPCGVAISKDGVVNAFDKALSCDSTSAFGGIFGFNATITLELAEKLKGIFFEAIIAPGYEAGALEILERKKNLRIMELSSLSGKVDDCTDMQIKTVSGGALLQDADNGTVVDLKTVSKREATTSELEDLLFAWKVCKHVKSNAIILARAGQTIGIGAGQMSRIDSTRLAVMKAGDAGLPVKGTVLSSDAFFPFRDNIDLAAKHGVTAIIHPGGSIRDDEVISAANENDIAMLCTNMRHFRH